MADIIFIPDAEEGHVFPSFKVAHTLQKAGYSLCYVGTYDVMQHVTKQGFAYKVILEDVYPAGSTKKHDSDLKPAHAYFLSPELKQLLAALKPRLIISSSALPLETLLLYYRFKIPQIIYHCMLPFLGATDRSLAAISTTECVTQLMKLSGEPVNQLLNFIKEQHMKFNSFVDLVSPLNTIPRFLLCPVELDTKNTHLGHNIVSLGPCIRESLASEKGKIGNYLSAGMGKKIIFGSAGSQTAVYPQKARKFFELLIRAMAHLPDCHLVLSAGKVLQKEEPGEVPSNVSIVEWVPQIELLPHASLAVVHGGLGTIKECVYYGVPMLVVPMGRDQMDNAKRVEEHSLGASETIENLTAEGLTAMIANILANETIQRGIDHMKAIFHEKENSGAELQYVRNYIGPPGQPAL